MAGGRWGTHDLYKALGCGILTGIGHRAPSADYYTQYTSYVVLYYILYIMHYVLHFLYTTTSRQRTAECLFPTLKEQVG